MEYSENRPAIAEFYSISYLYLGTIGFLSAFLIGSIASLLVFKLGYGRHPEDVPKNVFFPAIDRRIKRRNDNDEKMDENSEKSESADF